MGSTCKIVFFPPHTLSFLCVFCYGNATVVALEYRRHSRRRVVTLVRPHLREKDFFLSQSDLFHLLCRGLLLHLSHSMTHTHTRTHTHTHCRTPLDEGSARRTDMSPMRFEPAIPGSDRRQTHALERAVIGISVSSKISHVQSTKKCEGRGKPYSHGMAKPSHWNTKDCRPSPSKIW